MSFEEVFLVTVSQGKYLINGESAPTLDLISGKTYQFDLSDPSVSPHPFWFRYQGIPIDESLVNTTGQLGVDQVLLITAPGVSSGEYTYYCQNHLGMGGAFEIVRNAMTGSAGDDELYGNTGDDQINALAGNDNIFDRKGNDLLYGGEGDDIFHSGGGIDVFDGGAGQDTLIVDLSTSFEERSFEVFHNTNSGEHGAVDTDAGKDSLVSVENFTLIGNFNADVTGGDEDNVFTTDAGDDTLNSGAGDDTLNGGSGNNYLNGGAGDDIYLFDGSGYDIASDQSGQDTLRLFADVAIISDSGGYRENDDLIIVADDSVSKIVFQNAFDENGLEFFNYVNTAIGVDVIRNVNSADYIPEEGSHYLVGTREADNISAVGTSDISAVGYLGNDIIKGGNRADFLFGGSGNDILTGEAGNDYLEGGADNDTLNGGAGDDTLSGGLGSDTFLFEAGFGNDIISDFTHGFDELKFYDANEELLSSTDISETQNIDGDAVMTASDGSSVTLSGVSVYSLPFNIVSQKSGDTITVNFYLDPNQDPGDTGVGSFNATLGFEPNSLTYVSSSFADGLTGVANATALNTGALGLGGFGLTPVMDLDTALFSVTFDANAATESVQITLSEVEVDATSLSGGLYTIDLTGATLTGSVVTRSGAALSDVLLETDTGLSTQTSSDGAFGLDISGSEQVFSGSLSFSNTGSTKAISAADALDALKLSVGLPTDAGVSDAFSLISADFDQNGKVTASDALEILKYSVGLPTDQNAEWVFLDGNADYSDISKTNTNYSEGVTLADVYADTSISLTGILIGDVNDSYSGLIA